MKIVSFLIAILIFSILILFHELGHFLLAKANKIKVNEFSLGLGPTLFGFRKGDTLYSLKLLPFGGACMMEGEDENSDDEGAFGKKSVWARMSVVFAGPFFNFILAFVFAIIVLAVNGYDKPILSGVFEDYPAESAGLMEGDEIVEMNGKNIHFYREISSYSLFHQGESVEVTYKRDGELYTTRLTPQLYENENGTKSYLYGFRGSKGYEKGNVIETIQYSFYEVKYWIDTTLQSLKLLVTGGASINDLSGPVGIVQSMGTSYSETQKSYGFGVAFLTILNWGILLSANLGVMNLLPLPALDGGRLVFLIIEAIRRKKIPEDKEGMVHFVGIVLLLLLMVFIMFNDIRKIFM